MRIVNLLQRFKSLPVSTKRLLSLSTILGLFVALPLFVWAIVTQTFNTVNQRAASGEPQNTITCTTGMSDNFNTAGINSTKWTATSNVVGQNSTLRISGLTGEDTSHNLMSNLWIDGDFQAQVDVKQFEASTAGVSSLATAELKAYADSGNFFTIRWVKWTETNSQVNLYSSISGHVTQGVGVTLPANAAPTLRLVRNGSVIHGYYNTGAGFQELPGISATIYPGPVKPTIFAYKRGPAGTTVVFDNFSLGCIQSVTPTPTVRPNPTDCTPKGKTITVTPEGGAGRCHNIQTAINSASGSDITIHLMSGTYFINSPLNISGKYNLKIQGEGVAQTTLNFSTDSWGIKISSSSGGLYDLTAYGVSSTASQLITIVDSTNYQLSHINVNALKSDGIFVNNSQQIYVDSTNIKSKSYALEFSGIDGAHVTNNVIHDSQMGLFITNGQNINVENNLINHNTSGALLLQILSAGIANPTDKIAHNTVINNGSDAKTPIVQINDTVNSLIFKDNIVAYNNGIAVMHPQGIPPTTPSIQFSTNDFFGNNFNFSGIPNQIGTNGNISADPLIDFVSGYYCLLANSPALYGNINNHEYMGRFGPCSTSTPSPVVGDVNSDGHVNIIDIGIIIDNYGRTPLTNPQADLNNDGVINIVDIGIVVDNYQL